MSILNDIQKNTLRTTLKDIQMGHSVGNREMLPVYDTKDFIKAVSDDKLLMDLTYGRSPNELGVVLVHFTEHYQVKQEVRDRDES